MTLKLSFPSTAIGLPAEQPQHKPSSLVVNEKGDGYVVTAVQPRPSVYSGDPGRYIDYPYFDILKYDELEGLKIVVSDLRVTDRDGKLVQSEIAKRQGEPIQDGKRAEITLTRMPIIIDCFFYMH